MRMRKKILWALLMLLTSLGGMTAQSKMLPTGERLGRGVAALRAADGSVYVTWRTLETDKRGEPFNIYRNGRKLNKQPMTTGGTFFIDRQPIGGDAVYEVRGGNSNGSYTLKERAYRLSVATENVGYNQPPEAAYYIGPDDTSYLK